MTFLRYTFPVPLVSEMSFPCVVLQWKRFIRIGDDGRDALAHRVTDKKLRYRTSDVIATWPKSVVTFDKRILNSQSSYMSKTYESIRKIFVINFCALYAYNILHLSYFALKFM